ncbi:tyrosine-type recombinase/integrase [Halorussus halophilus]|uniref:tyrosine-type recombinase/integrase n=1 Tax=Halorussus halophilus TaxID=2650975 RepID=UPI001300E5E6|nr:site-specific integrase [Halorussus halophilus]
MVDIDAPLIAEESEQYLNEKQRVDYANQRRKFIEWLSTFGKDPGAAEGYTEDTVYRTAYRCGKFDRFVWELEDGYTIHLTHDHADEYMKYLARGEYSGSHKANTQDSLNRYFKWRHHELNEEPWEPELVFSSNAREQPPDFLSLDERKQIRQAALEYGSIPDYYSLTPDEREHWKKYVSQRLRKPLEEVSIDDWKQVNGWKYTSMVWVSLDAGLRPAEVGEASVSWVDISNRVLRIPASDSVKSYDNWLVSISERTADALERWLQERDNYDRYDDTDKLWLTREGNPYGSQSLQRLLLRLCDQAGIDTENRRMSWYAIRHSVGTYMTREEDLAAAKTQLRHKSVQTTIKYDQVPVEDRRSALDRMG